MRVLLKIGFFNFLIILVLPSLANAEGWIYNLGVSNKNFQIKGDTPSTSFRLDDNPITIALAVGSQIFNGDVSVTFSTLANSSDFDRTDFTAAYAFPVTQNSSFSLGYLVSETDIKSTVSKLENKSFFGQFLLRKPIFSDSTVIFKLGALSGDYNNDTSDGRSEGISYGAGFARPFRGNVISIMYDYSDLSFNTSPENTLDEKIEGITISAARAF
jgi:hypothetical protein